MKIQQTVSGFLLENLFQSLYPRVEMRNLFHYYWDLAIFSWIGLGMMCTLTPTFVLEVFKSEFVGKMVNVVFFWIFHNNSFGNRNPHYSKPMNRISSESTFSMKIDLLEIRPRDTEYDCAFFHKQEKIAIKYLLSSVNSC